MIPDAAASNPRERRDARSNEALVEVVLAGDRAAFETLVRRHQRPLVNHLFRLIGRRDDAVDLAQEVFIKVYVSLGSFDPRYRFTTWLYRIASNCAIDWLRRKRLPTCSLSSARPEDDRRDAPEEQYASDDPLPDQFLRASEIKRRLDAALEELPPHYRQLILLRHRQHCRYDEIARILELPIGTVKNRIFRARGMLKRSLGDVLVPEAGA